MDSNHTESGDQETGLRDGYQGNDENGKHWPPQVPNRAPAAARSVRRQLARLAATSPTTSGSTRGRLRQLRGRCCELRLLVLLERIARAARRPRRLPLRRRWLRLPAGPYCSTACSRATTTAATSLGTRPGFAVRRRPASPRPGTAPTGMRTRTRGPARPPRSTTTGRRTSRATTPSKCRRDRAAATMVIAAAATTRRVRGRAYARARQRRRARLLAGQEGTAAFLKQYFVGDHLDVDDDAKTYCAERDASLVTIHPGRERGRYSACIAGGMRNCWPAHATIAEWYWHTGEAPRGRIGTGPRDMLRRRGPCLSRRVAR